MPAKSSRRHLRVSKLPLTIRSMETLPSQSRMSRATVRAVSRSAAEWSGTNVPFCR